MAKTLAPLPLNPKVFRTQLALADIRSPSLNSWETVPRMFTYPTESSECLLYAREQVASALEGKKAL